MFSRVFLFPVPFRTENASIHVECNIDRTKHPLKRLRKNCVFSRCWHNRRHDWDFFRAPATKQHLLSPAWQQKGSIQPCYFANSRLEASLDVTESPWQRCTSRVEHESDGMASTRTRRNDRHVYTLDGELGREGENIRLRFWESSMSYATSRARRNKAYLSFSVWDMQRRIEGQGARSRVLSLKTCFIRPLAHSLTRHGQATYPSSLWLQAHVWRPSH